MFEDKTLVCKDCGQDFIFTTGEQEFYSQRVFRMNREDVRTADLQESHNSAGMVLQKGKGNNSMQFAHNAARKQKSRLNRVWISRYIAASALPTARYLYYTYFNFITIIL